MTSTQLTAEYISVESKRILLMVAHAASDNCTTGPKSALQSYEYNMLQL